MKSLFLNNTEGCFDLQYSATSNGSKISVDLVQIIFEPKFGLSEEELRPNFVKVCCRRGFVIDFGRKKCAKITEPNHRQTLK